MDVIVDTNILATDFPMRKNKFANLLDYLRRTNSSLVICKVVWDEVLAEYAERLKGDIERVNAAWARLGEARLTTAAGPDMPNALRELEIFKIKLRSPARGVRVTIHDDYSRVDINEIVRRGIKRIRPASGSGEELRDVILWLHALDYAKQKAAPVALISHDLAFIQDTDGDDPKKGKKAARLDEEQEDTRTEYRLHPHLLKDIADSGVEIKFYRFVTAFNRANTLRSRPVTQEWVARLGTQESLMQAIQGQLSARLGQFQGLTERIKEVSVQDLRLQ